MKTLVLLGSGEFTSAMNETDKYLYELNSNLGSVAVIPTAADDKEDCLRWIKKGVTHFTNLNIECIGIPLFERSDCEKKEILELLKTTSWIYFSGGSPIKLMSTIEKTSFLNEVINKYNNEKFLIGSSAGAMVMGIKIPTHFNFSLQKTTNFKDGLGLIPYVIIPHFNVMRRFSLGIIDFLLSSKENWICIDEDTALLINDEHTAQVMGKGSVHIFEGDSKATYKTGAKFILNL